MLNNSTWTAQTLKDKITDHFKDDNVTDNNIRLAVNFFDSIVGRAKRKAMTSEGQLSASVSVPTTGYDLSTLTNIGSLSQGFEVYEGSIKKENKLQKIKRDESVRGFYFIGNNIFLNGARAANINVIYQAKTGRIGESETLADYTLPIDQDLEQTIFRFTTSLFYESEFQPDLMVENEDKFYQEVKRFFAEPVVTRSIPL